MAAPHLLREVEWLGANRVRLFFASGKILETKLPVRSCRRARVVDCGVGLDPGDGLEFPAIDLYHRRGRTFWISASPTARKS